MMKYGLVIEAAGSSPHTRGAQPVDKSVHITPPDHPRIRGEHCIKICNELEANGIIPAYAGSTADRD